jgi:hypothetical protein
MTQFEKVSSKYGAPMGRHESLLGVERIRLFRVRLNSGGYDDGGAYWGLGVPLWCARCSEGGAQFVRAPTSRHAAELLGIDPGDLLRKINTKGN